MISTVSKKNAEKIAIVGIFSAFAAILSYIEVIISFGIGRTVNRWKVKIGNIMCGRFPVA